jgi:hypothetical protein
VALLIEASGKNPFAADDIAGSVLYLFEKLGIFLIPPLFVCLLIALANLVATRSAKSNY